MHYNQLLFAYPCCRWILTRITRILIHIIEYRFHYTGWFFIIDYGLLSIDYAISTCIKTNILLNMLQFITIYPNFSLYYINIVKMGKLFCTCVLKRFASLFWFTKDLCEDVVQDTEVVFCTDFQRYHWTTKGNIISNYVIITQLLSKLG